MEATALDRTARAPELTPRLLECMDLSGPRYTSYPTADRFVEAFDADAYRQALGQRAEGVRIGGRPPLSLYVHIPFCESVCYYCACNKIITKHHDRASAYLDTLEREIELHTQVLGTHEAVSQLHLGGGTPTFLSDTELERLMTALRRSFRFDRNAEISIEVDPRTATPERLAFLATQGFNRLSFGVQDFDPRVQHAVHRVQSFEMVRELIDSARLIGYPSINVDLIYGLPLQTPESFGRTIDQVAQSRPDRIALYAYAHLPQRFKPQRRILTEELPVGDSRLRLLQDSIVGFLAAGYTYIGMDHFALPDDPLAVARRQGRLHRNFQGYSTQPDCDLVGLGVSAIGRVGATYSQNAKSLADYEDAVHHRRFATARGLAVTRDDLVRRAVIMALMCQGCVEFESIELAHLISVPEYFCAELEQLVPLAELGLVELEPGVIQVTPLGWYLVRAVAMVFDCHLQADSTQRFSRIV